MDLSTPLIVFVWLCCAFGAAAVARNRGEEDANWFLYGLVFGPLAVICAFRLGVSCWYCHRLIHPKSTRCPHCAGELVLKSEVVAETASATPAEEPASEPETIAEDPVEKWKRDHPPAAEAAEGL